MPFSITCPGCESVYPVGEALVGKTIRCKKCGELITVTAPKAASAPAAKAKAAPRVVEEDEDEDDAPRKPARRRDDDEDDAPKAKRPARAAVADEDDDEEYDDDDDAPRKGKGGKKKGMPVPLIVGLVLGALALVGGGVGAYLAFGGKDEQPETAQNTRPANNNPPPRPQPAETPAPPPNTPPVKPDSSKPESTPKKEPNLPATKVEETAPPKTPMAVDATGTKPTASAVPPVRPMPRDSQFGTTDIYTPGPMNAITLKRVKEAAVYIKTETDIGAGTGSGWFGMEPGLVWTNAHVLFMKAPGSKEPKNLTLVLNAGTEDERIIKHHRLKILAVDRDIDLALIQVIGEKDLPLPLPVKPSAELVEGQPLFTIGFPFGQRVAQAKKDPEVSVRPTTFTAPRRNAFGQTRRLQIEGGVYTGNSGGAVVDRSGAVVGVVVEVTLDQLSGGQSQLGLAVPTEYVTGLLDGRIADVEYKVPYRNAGKVHIPVTLHCLDPLKRLNRVGVAAWVGDSSDKHRRPGTTRPDPLPSDSDYKVVDLKIDRPDAKTTVATGEVVLPDLPPGRAYWVQPFYGNASTPEYYLPGIRVPVKGPPVDRTAVDLVVKLRPGAKRAVTMSNSSDLSEYVEGEGEAKNERLTITKTLKVTEEVLAADKQEYAARLRMKFEEIGLKAELGSRMEQEAPKKILKLINDYVKLAEAVGFVNRLGEMFRYQVNVLGIQDPLGKVLVSLFANDALEAFQATSIPIPNKRIEPGEKWESSKNVRGSMQFGRIGKTGKPETTVREFKYVLKVTYTYIGQRERAGKKEAVVLIEGKVAQSPGSKEAATGELKGMALVELDTGLVVEAEIENEFELDTSGDGLKKRLSGINKYKLSRGASAQ